MRYRVDETRVYDTERRCPKLGDLCVAECYVGDQRHHTNNDNALERAESLAQSIAALMNLHLAEKEAPQKD